jgi:hypothetical protein
MGSKAYEIYKEAVGGKTWNGEDMKKFEEMPENIRNAWSSIDKHYTEKKKIDHSKVYDEYKTKNKDVKDFMELPENLKKSWINLDKNYNKLLKEKEPKAPKQKKEKVAKPKKEKEPKPNKKNGLIKSNAVFN